jgi:hypothetical protein
LPILRPRTCRAQGKHYNGALSIAAARRQGVISKELVYHVGAATHRELKHDPENWMPVFGKDYAQTTS